MVPAKILVVEDERIIAVDIKNSLINSGYTVPAIASSGEEAIEKAVEFQPDLVLMDIMLKGKLDGIEAAEEIHTRFNIPVVYLTSYADQNTIQRAKSTEPFGYILKPFEERELFTTIEIALRRHQAEVAIYQALEREKELKQLKSRFVSIVSHELRSPLSSILASAELLEHYSDPLTENQIGHLHKIKADVEYLHQLLDDVLAIGRTEVGRLQFNPAPLDLERFCQDLAEEMQVGAGDHYTIIFKSQDTPNPYFPPYLDQQLLQHIFTNLLSNAIKYSPHGSTVRFDLVYQQGKVVFQVQDQGIGIPEADQADLFDSFHRGSNVGTISGTGLGLSIVKQCVDLHSGAITVFSQVGVGTTFTVTLPLR